MMGVRGLLERAPRRELVRISALSVIAGVANALLVVIVLKVAEAVSQGARPGLFLAGIFGGAFVLYLQCDRHAMLRANVLIEELLAQVRLDMAETLRRSELLAVDSVGRGALYGTISQTTNLVSVAFPMLVESAQQLILLVASLAYMAFLSPSAVVLLGLGVGALLGALTNMRRDLQDSEQATTSLQQQLLNALTHLLHGAKELRLNHRRSEDVARESQRVSHQLTTVLTRSSHLFAQTILLTTLAINLILGAAAFLLPQLFEEQRDIMMKLVPLLMFCILPMAKLISLAPIMTQAQAGLVALGTIQEQISVPTPVAPSEARAAGAALTNFRDVAYTNLRFSYRNPQGEALFATGPLQFRFSRGETIFLVGGNGSGKSTTLRLLTALYPAEGGTIAVDGRALDATEKAGFRELFSAIFVDFHLFDRLYGLEGIDAEKVRALLQEMGLGGKVEFREGRFTDLQLSTGQRKRLALIAALLEDRPIYVFDEWAAEQDAHFRHEFYTRILPALKARGKTVIAVSHDDRYWSVADRVVRLDLGQVLWDKPGQALKEKDTTGLDG